MGVPTQESIVPEGPFSLHAAANFRFGPTDAEPPTDEATMRLAFGVDGGGYAGAFVTQASADGPVEVELELRDGAGRDAALAQVARILSLDHDGDAFLALGTRDRVLGALQRAHPGQRPVLFQTPYEAAAWSVLSARWPLVRGTTVRARLASDLGETFDLGGEEVAAFPGPDRLAGIAEDDPELSARKLERLRGVARAALAGDLDVDRLTELGPEAAHADVQRIAGIGPFYASLIVLRAVGFTDAWLGPDPGRVNDAFARFYGDADPEAVADGWRPFRTWATVLTRVAARAETVLP